MTKNITIGGGTIGVGFKKGGIGAEVSISSDGVRVGGGIGILEVDYNLRDGTGSVGWGFGVYEMVVSRKDCTFIKDFYIGGVYTHTEYQRDEKCDEDLPDKDKKNKETDPENNEEIEQDINAEPYKLEKDRFPLLRTLLVVMKWRYVSYYTKDGEKKLLEYKITNPKIQEAYPPEQWPNLLRLTSSRLLKPEGWKYADTHILRYFNYDSILEDTGVITIEYNSDDAGMTSDRVFDVTFGRPNSVGRGTLYSFFLGRYGTFLNWLSGKYVNWKGSQTSPVSDAPFGPLAERILLNCEFYDENGLIPPRKLSPPPPPPPKDMKCDCDKLDKRLKRIEATINTDLFIDENGVKIPKNLFIPGGRGDTEIKNYADYLATIIRIQAQSGIFPFSIEKKDINLVQSGNQSQTYYLPTATEAMKAVLENTIDNETKNDAILNLSVRIGIMVSKIVGKITFIEKTVQAISDFLGYPRREKIVRERIEVDPTLGARKQVGFRGFGPAPRNTNRKIEKQIELIRKKLEEGDKSLESALEDFLQPDDVAVRYEDFDDESGAPDLMELIDKGR